MAEWTRVKDKRTGHEYSVVNVLDHHQVLDKEATRSNGKPLPYKPRVRAKLAETDDNRTVPQLKEEARLAGVEGYSSMNKQELLDALEGDE